MVPFLLVLITTISAWQCPNNTSNCGVSGPTTIDLLPGTNRSFLVSSLCPVTDSNVSWSVSSATVVEASFLQQQDCLITITAGSVGDSGTIELKWCDNGLGVISTNITVNVVASQPACDATNCLHGVCNNNECVEFSLLGFRCSPTQNSFVNLAQCEFPLVCLGKNASDMFGFCQEQPTVCGSNTSCFCSTTDHDVTLCVSAAGVNESCNPSLGPFIPNANCENGYTCVHQVGAPMGASGICTSCPMFKCSSPVCSDNTTLGDTFDQSGCPSCPCCQNASGVCVDISVACTQDVQACPDGSFVTRDSTNDCAFTPCPSGCGNMTEVVCLVDGCFQKTCPANPSAVCVSNYCGGCNYDFYNERNELVDCEVTGIVCTMDVRSCPDGSFVSRLPELNCSFGPCPSDLCATDVQQCPDGSNVSRVPALNCSFADCPLCADANCTRGRCDFSGSFCVALSYFNETCNPSLGPDEDNANCAGPLICDTPAGLLGATGVCRLPIGTLCDDSECLCSVRNDGSGICVRAAKAMEHCNPSLGPFVQNASCASNLKCVSPPVLGAPGTCQLDNEACSDGSCQCVLTNQGLAVCALLGDEGENCNPSLGPYVDNANCMANLTCVYSSTLLGATGVCTTDMTVCALDVQQCDDGSWVSRNVSRFCQFDDCPMVCAQDMSDCPDGSMVSRDPLRNCNFRPCPDAQVCADDVLECSEGLWVTRNADNNCQFDECPSSPQLVCENGHVLTDSQGESTCVTSSLLGQPCNPSLGPFVNYSNCLAPLVCNQNSGLLGASGVCALPVVCGDSPCVCYTPNQGATLCSRASKVNETCNPSIFGAAHDKTACAEGLVCVRNSSLIGAAGVCQVSDCAHLSCNGGNCVIDSDTGSAKCIKMAQLNDVCNPSIAYAPICQDPLVCSRPPNAAIGAGGTCQLPTDCGNSTCQCTSDNTGAIHCVRVAKLNEPCYPSVGPFYDNSICSLGLICVPRTTAPGACGVCQTIPHTTPNLKCSSTGKESLCVPNNPPSLTLTANNKPYVLDVSFPCTLQSISTSYIFSQGVAVQVTFAKKNLFPVFSITASGTIAKTGATGTIVIEWCEKGTNGAAYGSASISVQVLGTNATIGGTTIIMADTVSGSASMMEESESPNNTGHGLSAGTKGWISVVVIVGTTLLVLLACYAAKKCMSGRKYAPQPEPTELEGHTMSGEDRDFVTTPTSPATTTSDAPTSTVFHGPSSHS